MNILKGLIGAGVGYATGGPAGAVAGGFAGLDDSSQKQANASLGMQRQAANQQQQLFQAAQPSYLDLLNALRAHAGFGPQQMQGAVGNPQQTQGDWGFPQRHQPPAPGSLVAPVAAANPYDPYTNVTSQQQGIYANPTDRLRFIQAEDQNNNELRNRLNALHVQMGQHGLTNSSMDASAQSALVNSALTQQNAFARQLAINAPGEYEHRLSLLSGALNPGLGAGPISAGLYGQQAGIYGNQAMAQNQAMGGAMSNLQLFNALKQARGGYGGGGGVRAGRGGGGFGVDMSAYNSGDLYGPPQ